MTTEQIDAEATKRMVPLMLAKQIRQLLDKAKETYVGNWDSDDVETEVQTLVFE